MRDGAAPPAGCAARDDVALHRDVEVHELRRRDETARQILRLVAGDKQRHVLFAWTLLGDPAERQELDLARHVVARGKLGDEEGAARIEGGGEETRSNPWLAELQQENFVEINPKDANDRGVKDGEYVWVKTPTGEIAFNDTGSAKPIVFSRWAAGERPKISGRALAWSRSHSDFCRPPTMRPSIRTGSEPSATDRGSSSTRHARRRVGSSAASRASRPMKSPLSTFTAKPRPASNGVSSGVMSEPQTR